MSRYDALANYLLNLKTNTEVLPIIEIENILGFPLPKSATKHHAWWSNDENHTQARAGWLRVSWRVSGVDFKTKQITFVGNPRETLSIIDYRSTPENGPLTKKDFKRIAQQIMSSYFNTDLSPRKKPTWPRIFNLVSSSYSIVGDSKRYSILDDDKIPPSYFSSITEQIWILEKISAKIKFLVFGGYKRVPKHWLKLFGNYNSEIEFYFIHNNGLRLERLFEDIKEEREEDKKSPEMRSVRENIEHKEPRLSDQIRDFVGKKLIEPARRKGEKEITIRAGDVHSKMGLRNRIPAVCSAIKTKKFLQIYDIRLVNEEGPPQGANVFYTYKLG